MKNTLINRRATLEVAKALGELNKQVIYVGGAVVSLYIDDPAAVDVRPTKDVDIILELTTPLQLEALQMKLNELGFKQTQEDDVICRFRLNDIKVDIMSTHAIEWAPTNRWFEAGFRDAFEVDLDDITIKLMPFVYFLASKFDAFNERGSHDPRMSHDFEDIVYLLNYRSDFYKQVVSAGEEVKSYLLKCFKAIMNDSLLQEAIIANLYYEDQTVRFERIKSLIETTIEEG